jgi:hypothetical protein
MQQPQAEGLCLGPLGSIVVSEVIFGALADNEFAAGRGAASLAEALAELAREYYPANVFDDVPEIECMDQLVEFTAEIAGLQQAVPAFL